MGSIKYNFQFRDKVEVEWFDSMFHGIPWSNIKVVDNFDKELDHRTCGYFVKDSGKSITLTLCLKDADDNIIGPTFSIPKCSIKIIKRL